MRAMRCSAAILMALAALLAAGAAIAQPPLQSEYFNGDQEAYDIALGLTSVQFFVTPSIEAFDVRWRIQNALRMLGYEKWGMPYGEVIDSTRILEIDAELDAKEEVIQNQASKISDWEDIWAVDFADNIPQEFGVHLVATIFDLFNASGTAYQDHSVDCVQSNFVPQMCGALVEMGTVTGESCKDVSIPLLDPITIQTPELFGFFNVRREILAEEYPTTFNIGNTFGYVATLVHEFVHDVDAFWRSSSYMHRDWDRANTCGSFYMDTNLVSPTPFRHDGATGEQDIDEFVSIYASGLSNTGQIYRFYEDHAESVTAYILLPEYFRDRMQNNLRLQEKYLYIRDHHFNGVEFTNPALIEHPSPFVLSNTLSAFYRDNEIAHFDVDAISLPEPGFGLQLAACLAVLATVRRRRVKA